MKIYFTLCCRRFYTLQNIFLWTGIAIGKTPGGRCALPFSIDGCSICYPMQRFISLLCAIYGDYCYRLSPLLLLCLLCDPSLASSFSGEASRCRFVSSTVSTVGTALFLICLLRVAIPFGSPSETLRFLGNILGWIQSSLRYRDS